MRERLDLRYAQPLFVNNGVWIRPFGKLVYTMPPYIMNDNDLALLTQAMVKTVASL